MNLPLDSVCQKESQIQAVLTRLLAYCRSENWSGYDPYDALNSRIIQSLPFLNSRIPQLVLTQALKRSPINLRPLLQVPKTQNPKAIALFLIAFLRLEETEPGRYQSDIQWMVEQLVASRSKESPHWCWGYSFPWQGRHVVVPRGAANLVCTTFVARALLDCYERHPDRELLAMAASAAEYIHELYWQNGKSAGFSYPLPSLHSQIHNANFLAAALLCQVYAHTGEKKFLEPALDAARYSASKQQPDGSWYYGEAKSQHWIDNFHTGYNLSALRQIDSSLSSDEFEANIRKGFGYYRAQFFREDGAVKYFHDRAYPVDAHCVAQSILTLLEFQHLDAGNLRLGFEVFQWAARHMWDERGFFYYRVLRCCTVRTSYMRWSQAWMFLALAALRREISFAGKHLPQAEAAAVGQ